MKKLRILFVLSAFGIALHFVMGASEPMRWSYASTTNRSRGVGSPQASFSGTHPTATGSVSFYRGEGDRIRARRLLIVTGKENTPVERRATELLQNRILRRSQVEIELMDESAFAAEKARAYEVVILTGMPQSNATARLLFEAHSIRKPGGDYPGPEGFILRSLEHEGIHYILISGADERGTLFGVGKFLRAIRYHAEALEIPKLDIEDKPAFPIRGSNMTGPDDYIEDMALWGFNAVMRPVSGVALEIGQQGKGAEARIRLSEFLHNLGMAYILHNPPNSVVKEDFKPEMRGTSEDFTKVCPHAPGAWETLLQEREYFFQRVPYIDAWFMNSGDVAGCHDERCRPWVKTYLKLCEEIATLLRKYHPKAQVWLSNQSLSLEENQMLLDYLDKEKPDWVNGFVFGPGGDELSIYTEETSRSANKKWERYIQMGRNGRYLMEIHHQLPPSIDIILFPDLTHWIRSQYGLHEVDPALVRTYGRKPFFTRPGDFYQLFRDTAPYAIGAIPYREGRHDDFNIFVWTRLLWNPQLSDREAVGEYAEYYFGAEAAPEMVEAAFQLEENQRRPVLGNSGIDRMVELVERAGQKMPELYMRDNWRYRLFLVKACMDKYVQLNLETGKARMDEAHQLLRQALQAKDPKVHTEEALKILQADWETPEMKILRDKGWHAQQEISSAMEVSPVADLPLENLRLLQVDLVNREWTVRKIEEAVQTGNSQKIKAAAREVLYYEEPEEGGFYDDSGNPAKDSHRKTGVSEFTNWESWVEELDPNNRLSQNTLAYATDDEEGIIYSYSGLDSKAKYRVKVTYVQARGGERVQKLTANGLEVHGPMKLPEYTAQQFVFDLPPASYRYGHVDLVFQKVAGTGNAIVSEVWVVPRKRP